MLPLSARAVRAAARWAINRMYDDVLPTNLEPVSETISPMQWHVSFEHAGHRYSAWSSSRRGIDAEVQRDQLRPD